MDTNRGSGKRESEVHSYNEMILSKEKGQTTDKCNGMDAFKKHYAK